MDALGPERLLKTQIFEKTGNLSSEEIFLAYFSRIIECDNSHGTIYRGQQVILRVIVQLIFFFGT